MAHALSRHTRVTPQLRGGQQLRERLNGFIAQQLRMFFEVLGGGRPIGGLDPVEDRIKDGRHADPLLRRLPLGSLVTVACPCETARQQ